jgi:hypothetical protein
MPNAVLVQVADAVTALLNTVPSPFSQSFTAERNYPDFATPLESLGELKVDVVAGGHKSANSVTRSDTDYECNINVIIRKRFCQTDRQEEGENGRPLSNEAIDEMILLVEEVHEYLQDPDRRQLNNSDSIDAWIQPETIFQPTWNPDDLKLNQQFTASILFVYTASKTL